MTEPLVLEYRLNWRVRIALVRAQGGFTHIARKFRRMRCNQLSWSTAFLFGIVAGCWFGSLPVTILSLVLFIWMVTYAFMVRNLGRFTMLKMRRVLRQSGDRRIRLTVTPEGFQESDEGQESFAPWSAVKSYVRLPRVLAIEVGPHLWSVIPTSGDAAHAGLVQRLLGELEDRQVPQAAPSTLAAEIAA